MSRERVQRWSLALIGLFMLPTAIQATFAPESWCEDLVQGAFHFGYHVGHLDGLDTVDRLGFSGSLVSIPILAALSLWAGLRPRMAS
jgi:hypothetical protein